jgi:hypothetical protein
MTLLRCPYCAVSLDGELNLAGRDEPRDWDPRVCVECGHVAVYDFTVPGGLRESNGQDWHVWDERGLTPLITRTRQAQRAVR